MHAWGFYMEKMQKAKHLFNVAVVNRYFDVEKIPYLVTENFHLINAKIFFLYL